MNHGWCTQRSIILLYLVLVASAALDENLLTTYVHPDFVPLRNLRPVRQQQIQIIGQPEATPINAAGFRCEDSALVEAAGTKCSLLARSFGPLGCQRVLADLAAERGRSLDGVPPAFRNRRVADACPYSCGLCDRENY